MGLIFAQAGHRIAEDLFGSSGTSQIVGVLCWVLFWGIVCGVFYCVTWLFKGNATEQESSKK